MKSKIISELKKGLSSVAKYSGLFKYELQIEYETQYTITIHHQFGEKLSYRLKQTILVELFNNILGGGPSLHSHTKESEGFYVIDEEFLF
jgi:hypothetical protein